MVDSSKFVGADGSIDFGAIASRLVSSYILVAFAGLASLVYAIFEVPANLLEDFLAWIGETLGLGFSVPAGTIGEAWQVVGDVFPIAGPLDYAIGVILIVTFFVSVRWMIGRVMEGL